MREQICNVDAPANSTQLELTSKKRYKQRSKFRISTVVVWMGACSRLALIWKKSCISTAVIFLRIWRRAFASASFTSTVLLLPPILVLSFFSANKFCSGGYSGHKIVVVCTYYQPKFQTHETISSPDMMFLRKCDSRSYSLRSIKSRSKW